ncbi:hypothetical protein [Uliginosibacterium gangwonense]|uniref:hypothetical protein n=1 Tax=Uliginosibacterium gangwonense TaxID=392736 RepID=UPI0012F80EFB|nr:hypothetical protein [Uliginosibacterium gangwonense]
MTNLQKIYKSFFWFVVAVIVLYASIKLIGRFNPYGVVIYFISSAISVYFELFVPRPYTRSQKLIANIFGGMMVLSLSLTIW